MNDGDRIFVCLLTIIPMFDVFHIAAKELSPNYLGPSSDRIHPGTSGIHASAIHHSCSLPLTAPNERHRRRHDRDERHICVERQLGHIDNRVSNVVNINCRFGCKGTVRLRNACTHP